MFIRLVAWFFVMIAAYPVHSLSAVTAIVLVLTGKASVIVGVVICGGLLYIMVRRFVPGFVRGIGFLSRYRRRWSSLCWTTYKQWAAQTAHDDENSHIVDFASKRVDDDA